MNRDSNADAAPKLRDRIREVTRETILGAAENVFAEEGMNTARMETIAARAGVSVGTLYNYFNDKSTLFTELLKDRHEKLIDFMDAALAAQNGRPFREQLRAFCGALFDHFTRYRRFFVVLMQAEHKRVEGGSIRPPALKSHTMNELYVRVQRLIKQGIKEKALRPELAEYAPLFLTGAFRGVVMRDLLYDERPGSPQEVADAIVAFFLEGAGTRGHS